VVGAKAGQVELEVLSRVSLDMDFFGLELEVLECTLMHHMNFDSDRRCGC